MTQQSKKTSIYKKGEIKMKKKPFGKRKQNRKEQKNEKKSKVVVNEV